MSLRTRLHERRENKKKRRELPPVDKLALEPLTPRQAALKTAGLIALFLLGPLVFLSAGMIALGASSTEQLPPVFSSFFTLVGYVISVTYLLYRYRKKGYALSVVSGMSRTFIRREKAPELMLTALAGVLAGVAVSAVLMLLPEGIRASYEAVALKEIGTESFYLSLFTTLIFSPVSEEIVFRGIFFRSLRRGWSERTAMLIMAAVFGLFHMNLVWSLYAFGFGVLFGEIARRQDSIIPGIVLHFGVNLSSLLRLVIPDVSAGGVGMVLLMLAVGGICAAGAFHLIKRLYFADEKAS